MLILFLLILEPCVNLFLIMQIKTISGCKLDDKIVLVSNNLSSTLTV